MRFFLFLLSILPLAAIGQNRYEVKEGSAYFKSDAPLELIEAASSQMKGLLDADKRTFAFSIPMSSFKGFNSPLQREHFNENYMESVKYPNATFAGKIIEDTDFSKDGEYTVRAKGKLTVHGVEQERIIKSTMKVKAGKVYIDSQFTVLLKEHNIDIPHIVYQKIAEEISVKIKLTLAKM